MLTLYYLMKKSTNHKKFDLYDYFCTLEGNRRLRNHDLSSRCRICLQKGSVSVANDTDITEALETFANIKISSPDYSKHLCLMCLKFIKSAIVFQRIAKQTEVFLKQPVKEEAVDEQFDYDYSQEKDFSDESNNEGKTEHWTNEDFCQVKKEAIPKLKLTAKVTCNICSKVINRAYYKQHMTMHDPDHKKYVCDVCGKSFRLRCAYHNHSLTHRNDFPYKCQFCPYKGKYAELLKTHMRTHTGDYRYMCTECPARFLFKSNLNRHMLKHKDPQFQCDACKRAFHTKLALQRHFEADHLGIKNHVCNLCGKAFGYRNAMMKHQRHVHKREKLSFGRMPSYLHTQHSPK